LAEKKSARPSKQTKKKDDAPADLEARLGELQEELFRLRFQFATRQLTNTTRIRQVRRDVARVKTQQRQRELAAQAGAA